MRHVTRIESRPTGDSTSLLLTGRQQGAGLIQISVSKNQHLTGNAATGTCSDDGADIDVSPDRFRDMSAGTLPFNVILQVNAGTVSSCVVEPARRRVA